MKPLTWQCLTDEPDALGESPFWHPVEHTLYWVDIPGRALRRANGFTGASERWALPSEPGCVAPARGGGLVLALRDGLYRAREWGGALQPLQPAPYDPATTRFNDGRADAEGRLWVGTLYEPRDRADAALYCYADGARPGSGLRRMAGGATTGNGLAFSPDGRTLYWSDTPGHVIRAWDRDPATGAITAPREFHRFPAKPPGWQPEAPGAAERFSPEITGSGISPGSGPVLVMIGEALREVTRARCPARILAPGGGEPGQRHGAQSIDDAAELDARLLADRVDVTLPGAPPRPVGHPHLPLRGARLALLVDQQADHGGAVLAGRGLLHLPAEEVGEELHAVTDAEHRYAQLEDSFRRTWRFILVHGIRPA